MKSSQPSQFLSRILIHQPRKNQQSCVRPMMTHCLTYRIFSPTADFAIIHRRHGSCARPMPGSGLKSHIYGSKDSRECTFHQELAFNLKVHHSGPPVSAFSRQEKTQTGKMSHLHPFEMSWFQSTLAQSGFADFGKGVVTSLVCLHNLLRKEKGAGAFSTLYSTVIYQHYTNNKMRNLLPCLISFFTLDRIFF